MNIYCNGDSFTAGEELLDHMLIGWPGYRPTESTEFDHSWWQVRKRIGSMVFDSTKNFLEKQKEVSWAGHLNKLNSNISVINGAVGGAAIEVIANRTIADLVKYQDQKFDFIFIQLTGPNRFQFYNSAEEYFMISRPIGHIDKFPKIEKEIAKKYIELYSDKEFSIKYLYSMIKLKYAVKGITGKDPIFLSSHYRWKNYIINPLLKDENLSNDKTIQVLINNSGILDISNECVMEDVQIKNKFLHTPLLHFEPRCHEEFAKVIYNKYIDKNRC